MPESGPEYRIDYVEFGAADIEKTKQFYTAAFGWRFTDYGPDYTSFHDGRLSGGFTTESTPGTRGGALVVLYTRALETAIERVKAAGGTIVREPFEFPGGRRFHFTDPDGNELALWSDGEPG
jgi:predicted enzyme related to lactoylglutathione lyase